MNVYVVSEETELGTLGVFRNKADAETCADEMSEMHGIDRDMFYIEEHELV